MILLSSVGYSQKFNSEFNFVIDFDGKTREEKRFSGRWTVVDSTLYQFYGKDSLEYKIYKIVNRDVYYINDFGELIKVLFMANGQVLKTNTTRPKEYLIYRKENL